MMMSNNDKIKELLKNRDVYFESIKQEEQQQFDDCQLNNYNSFFDKYNNLSQLEKDIWFLNTQMKKSKIADLYAVSKSYITQITKIIEKKLK